MKPLIDAAIRKTCTICKEDKLLEDFHPNKSCKHGVVGICKPCYKLRISKWYSDNRRKRQDVANSRNRLRKQLAVEHFGSKCLDCKQSYQNCVYQFHHLDMKTKDANPSYFMTGSLELMWKELNKCVMLCANCHIVRHKGKEGVNETTY